MKRIHTVFMLLLLAAGVAWGASKAQGKQKKDAFDMLSDGKKEQLIKMFCEDYPFVSSKEYKNYPETRHQFFTEPIYKKLRGNFMRGYQYNEGFQFSGNTLYLSTIKSVTEGRPYLKMFVDVLNQVFVGNGVKFVPKGKSRYEIGMCIVSVTPKLIETSFPGVFLEVMFSDTQTGKSYFLRFGQGSKRGLEKAMADSCGMVLASLLTTDQTRAMPES